MVLSRSNSRLALRCLAIGLVALGFPLAAGAQNPANAARASLIAADRAASADVLRRGLAAGLGSVLADSAVFLYEGAPILAGRDRVSQHLSVQLALTRLRMQWLPIIVAVSSDGAFGVTSGPTLLAATGQPADSVLHFGHYISVWRRTADGTWKIVALVENGLADPDSLVMTEAARTQPRAPDIGGGGRPFADADLAFARLAADSGAPAAFGTWAAPDATTPPGPGMITVGAPAIRARMQANGAGTSVWSWHPVYAGASQAGDLGFTVGESVIAASRDPGAETSHGKYLTIWRRQPDGSIKFIMDTGNARPAK